MVLTPESLWTKYYAETLRQNTTITSGFERFLKDRQNFVLIFLDLRFGMWAKLLKEF